MGPGEILNYTSSFLWAAVEDDMAPRGRRLAYITPSFIAATGARDNYCMTQMLRTAIHPQDAPRVWSQWSMASESRASYGGLLRYRVADTWRWHAMRSDYIGRGTWLGCAVDVHDLVMTAGLHGPALVGRAPLGSVSAPFVIPQTTVTGRARELADSVRLESAASLLRDIATQLIELSGVIRDSVEPSGNAHAQPVVDALRVIGRRLATINATVLAMAG